jgi:hypothetical protein
MLPSLIFGRFDQLKSYLHCQMMVAMAIDLGLQRSSKETRNAGSKLFQEDHEPLNFVRPMERERTWLAVYVASTGSDSPLFLVIEADGQILGGNAETTDIRVDTPSFILLPSPPGSRTSK